MTTMNETQVNCCICGTESIHLGVDSTNALGYPDLDTRPPEMERSTIYYQIQRCPSCGYCDSDLSACPDGVEKLVKSRPYQEILGDLSVPVVASSFLASSFIHEQMRQFSKSAWSAIHASWICDDENDAKTAKQCRERALSMIEIGESLSQLLSEQDGASEAITIDLLRRVGKFQDASDLAQQTKAKDIEGVIKKIISYEESLIFKKNADAHTISEAVKGDESDW